MYSFITRKFRCAGLALALAATPALASESDGKWAPAVTPKPLSSQVDKGIHWLLAHQLENGGWGQGEESRHMGGGEAQANQANVADTCMAALALLRSGSTPKSGPHKQALARAVGYVVAEIEASDPKELYVTSNRTTRVQGKLGPYIDTFISAQLLAEVRDQMPDERSELRTLAALDTVLTKIRRHQKSDGTWDARGWAPALSQAVAGKALNRAAQAGAAVDETTRARAEEYAGEQFNEATGGFKGEGSAGVGLYGAASSLGTLSDSVNTNDGDERDAEEKLAKTKDQAEKKELQAKLQRYREVKRKKSAASGAVVNRLADPQFRAGFGSNGGEEFLSYMLVSESLVVNGGAEWKKWDAEITANINRVQNADGSWTGHHCITGRTFVTSSALLVLMADRAPVPLAAKIKRG